MPHEHIKRPAALADAWAHEAGMSLEWRTLVGASVLTDPDPTKRALWRCALELDDSLRSLDELQHQGRATEMPTEQGSTLDDARISPESADAARWALASEAQRLASVGSFALNDDPGLAMARWLVAGLAEIDRVTKKPSVFQSGD